MIFRMNMTFRAKPYAIVVALVSCVLCTFQRLHGPDMYVEVVLRRPVGI